MLKHISKIMIIVLCFLSLTLFSETLIAKATTINNNKLIANRQNELYQNEVNIKTYKKNDLVEAIIVLKGDNLLEGFNPNKYSSISDYLQTPTSITNKEIITNKQTAFIDKLTNLNLNVDYQNSYQYKVLLNAISIKTNAKTLDTIAKLTEVEDVYISNQYNVDDLSYETYKEEEIYYSDNIMNSQTVNDLGYTGKGIVVAVLDTGLDITHVGFSKEVTEPRFTKEALTEIIKNNPLVAKGIVSGEATYYNSKIPFLFDYAGNDTNVNNDVNQHGTHVCGIVGANSGQSIGVAPDAQIIPMKVFSDEGLSVDTYVLAAIEDCLNLGVDVINMSLGTGSGSSYTTGKVEEIYSQIRGKGINLVVAAGNDSSVGNNNIKETHLPLASNPDYGVVASPSTYKPALSVASVDNPTYMAAYIQVEDDLHIPYAEATQDMRLYINTKFKNQTIEYVILPGVGKEIDYQGLDVEGKIVVVARGDISFTEKHDGIVKHKGVGMICYNPDNDDLVGMQIDNQTIPCVFITNSHYRQILDRKGTNMSFSLNNFGNLTNPDAKKVSIFSSWGTTRDLEIKPEISAPGAYIYSTVNYNEYAQMSGTSMASPNIAGVTAILRQYINENFPSLSLIEKVDFLNTILMNTADPTYDSDGIYSAIRAQGAGIANAIDAINTKAYLNVENSERPKAELGSSTQGVYQYTIEINNFSNKPITYELSTVTMTDKSELIDEVYYYSKKERYLTKEEVEIKYSDNVVENKITVEPNTPVKVEIKIQLLEQFKQNQQDIFINGSYIEGYTFLNTDEDERLNIPFLGFYGDYTQLPILEGSVYVEEAPYINMLGCLGVVYDAYGTGYELGLNYGNDTFYNDKIYFSCSNMKNNMITSYNGLLRNIDYIKHQIYDTEHNLIFEKEEKEFRKSFYYANGDYVTAAANLEGWDGTKLDGTIAKNGESFTYVTTVGIYGSDHETSIKEETWSFDFKIDSNAPRYVSSKIVNIEGKNKLEVKISDNIGVATVQLWDLAMNHELSERIPCLDTGVQTAVFDLDELLEEIKENVVNQSQIKIAIYDWAYNFTYETITIGPSTIRLNNEYKIGIGGTKDLEPILIPNQNSLKDLTFTSSDERIATVDENGFIHGISEGEAIITIKSLNNVQAQTKVIVKGMADTAIKINNNQTTLEVTKGLALKCLFEPDNVVDTSVIWSSSDENIATITKTGYVIGIKPGKVTITAISSAGNKDTIQIEVIPQAITSISIFSTNKILTIGEKTVIEMISISPVTDDYSSILFSSSDDKVLTVDENGNLEAISAGKAIITVSSLDGKITDTLDYVVVEVKPFDIQFKQNIELSLNDKYQIEAEVIPINTTNKQLTFISSDPNIATIDENGLITPLKVGNVRITISCENINKDCYVSINPINIEEIRVNTQFIELDINESIDLQYEVIPNNATYKKLIWNSSNINVVKVIDGKITGLNAGTATIKSTTMNGLETLYYIVVKSAVSTPFEVTTEFNDINLYQGEKYVIELTEIEQQQLTLLSTNDEIAIVHNNKVYALNDGVVKINVYQGNDLIDTFEVNVKLNEENNCTSKKTMLIIETTLLLSLLVIYFRKR